MSPSRSALVLSLLAVFCLPACSKKSGEEGTESGMTAGDAPTESAPAKPRGPHGVVEGVVKLDGTAPEMKDLRRGSDRVCATKEMKQETVITDGKGGLGNVLVRIKPGQVEANVPDEPVIVDQVDCMYRPRVQGAVVGQKMLLKNSDATFHNIHGRNRGLRQRQGIETLFNKGQPPKAPALKAEVRDAEVVELKCDAHGWMKGFIVVGDNPYFSTSKSSGAFRFEAPVGTFKVQAWHELYGTKTAEVTVAEGKTSRVDFSFKAATPEGPSTVGGPGADGGPAKE